MGIFSSKKEKQKMVLVFDVGSSSVGGALFFVEDSGIPRIVYSTREPIVLESEVNIDRFLNLTLKSLESITGKICLAGLGHPDEIFCVLSSPWYLSQTRVIKLEKNTPFIFTTKLADSLIEKEIGLFEAEYLDKYSKEGSPVRSIEFKNIKTLLNGYETIEPLNQKVKEIEMTLLISISGKEILSKIEDIIGRHFHTNTVRFCSFALAAFVVTRALYSDVENFLLMDIGGEVTEISMIKKGVLHSSVSFPLGRNFIIRRISSELGSTLPEAKSLLSLYKDSHASDAADQKLGKVIDKYKIEWRDKFQESLTTLSNDISIPSIIYIAVDKELAEFFQKSIESEQFNQYTLTESKFRVNVLSVEVFHGMAKFEEEVVRDPFLLIDSIYINRFLAKI